MTPRDRTPLRSRIMPRDRTPPQSRMTPRDRWSPIIEHAAFLEAALKDGARIEFTGTPGEVRAGIDMVERVCRLVREQVREPGA